MCESFQPHTYACSPGGDGDLATCTARVRETAENRVDTVESVKDDIRHNRALAAFGCGEER